MAIIQMFRGHYVQLAVDRRTEVITAVATKRGCQPIFFTTLGRRDATLASEPVVGLEDARAAVLEALDSAQAQVVFDELKRVQERTKTPRPTRYETRHLA